MPNQNTKGTPRQAKGAMKDITKDTITLGLLKLKENGFDYEKTAEQLGVHKKIIRLWVREHGDEVFGRHEEMKEKYGVVVTNDFNAGRKEVMIDIQRQIEKERALIAESKRIREYESDFTNLVFLIKYRALSRLNKLVVKSKSVKDLAYLTSVLASISTGEDPLQPNGGNKRPGFVEMLQKEYKNLATLKIEDAEVLPNDPDDDFPESWNDNEPETTT